MSRSVAAIPQNCTLHAVLAAGSPIAVVYRRGPSKQTCLIRWNRTDDTFEVGQWFKGSVYPERSALAPDGAHLLTFMGTFRPPFRTWTVLSRPPYFTALALWPKGDTWGGGGAFLNAREFVLAHNGMQLALARGFALPEGFVQLPPGPETVKRFERALARDPAAWRVQEGSDRSYATRTLARAGPPGIGLLSYWHAENPRKPWQGALRHDLTQGRRRTRLDGARWADFDANGDLLLTQAGCLYRCPAAALSEIATGEDVFASARKLADFTDLRFRALVAPYAAARAETAEGEPSAFAPILDRVTKEDRRAQRQARKASRPDPGLRRS